MKKLADFFATNYPDLKGFNRRGLYRMKQFYELYKDNEKVSPLVTQLSWTNHLKIMSACKSMEERIFYMNMCIKERLSKRELERQIDSGYYERYMLSQKPQTPAIEESKRTTGNLTGWHQTSVNRLGIDMNKIRRKRAGFDGVIHFIPGLFNDDLNFRAIDEKTVGMIAVQASVQSIEHPQNTTDLYAEDVQLISKDGKIYYLPMDKAE